MALIKIFKKYGKKYLWTIGLIVAITFLLNYIRSLIPLYIGKVFEVLDSSNYTSSLPPFLNKFFENKETVAQLLTIMIAIILTCVVREIVNIATDMLVGYSRESIGYEIQTNFYNHIQQLPYTYLNRVETGDLIQRATNDLNRVKEFYGDGFPEMLSNVIKIVIFSTQMLLIDKKIGLCVLAFLPLIILLAIFFFKKMFPIYEEFEENEGKLSTCVQENLTGIRVVKAFANEDLEIKKQHTIIDNFGKVWKRMMGYETWYWPTGDFLGYFMLLVAFTLGVISINGNRLDLASVVSLLFYVEYIMWPARMLGRQLSGLSRTNIAAKRIQEIFDMPTEFEVINGNNKPEIKGDIEFKDVSFKFDDANIPTLKNISFKVKKGQTVAIIGKTGCGKSTLMSLLNRLIEPTSGEIIIDGNNIKDIEKHYLRSNIALVLQEPFLFSKTIAENIGIVDEKADLSIIKKVASIASVDTDIERFEQGYNTLVGERGVTLSGGQKQRVSIARAIVEEKPILVFDDSLSAVDTETDLKIRTALNNRKTSSTTFIITHRIATAKDADLIVVLGDGTIENVGTHDELINKEGLYKKIWSIQNSFSEDGE